MTEFTESNVAIEAIEFEAALSVASSIEVFLRIAKRQTAFRRLQRDLPTPDAQLAVSRRMLELAAVGPPDGYAHDHDVALAAYGLALSLARSPLAGSALGVMDGALRAPWTAEAARFLRRRTRDHVTVTVAALSGTASSQFVTTAAVTSDSSIGYLLLGSYAPDPLHATGANQAIAVAGFLSQGNGFRVSTAQVPAPPVAA